MDIEEITLPSFDELLRLAAEDESALEQIRSEVVEKHISMCPQYSHEKLKRMQFRIEGIIRKANNPVHSCVLLNRLMLENAECLIGTMKLLPSKEDMKKIKYINKPNLKLVKDD